MAGQDGGKVRRQENRICSKTRKAVAAKGQTDEPVSHAEMRQEAAKRTVRQPRGFNPFRIDDWFGRGPSVARAAQRWAEGCSPVGIEGRFPSTAFPKFACVFPPRSAYRAARRLGSRRYSRLGSLRYENEPPLIPKTCFRRGRIALSWQSGRQSFECTHENRFVWHRRHQTRQT
jgi:hypothetical protein